MTPISKSDGIVISYMLTKIFNLIRPKNSDFKLKNESHIVDPYSANLSKFDLYALKNPDPRSEKWDFNSVLERSGGSATYQKNRLESRIPVICVTSA